MKFLLINDVAQEQPLLIIEEEKFSEEKLTPVQDLFRSLEIQGEDLISRNISLELLRDDLNPVCTSRLLRPLAIDRHLHKLCLLPFMDGEGLGDSVDQATCCQAVVKWFCTRVWPTGQVIPFRSTATLKKIYGINGFLGTFEKWISRVWSGLLISFLVNDLYYYFAYPDERYDMTLSTIFLTRSDHEKSLTASLTSVEIWPELFVLPLMWAVIKAFQERCRAQQLTAENITQLITDLENYNPSFWQDVIAWFLPIYKTRDTLDVVQRALLWDNRLSIADRHALQEGLVSFVRRAKKISRFYSVAIFGALARGLDLKDLQKLRQHHIQKDELVALIETKLRALSELYYQTYVSRTKSISLQIPRYVITNYFLWSAGQHVPCVLEPFFWFYKLARFYLQAKFFYTAYLGFSELIARFLAKRDCENVGKLWLYMDVVADYQCTVCGDLPLFYPDVFNVTRCIAAYSRQPRNASDLINVFQRLDVGTIREVDLSHQLLTDQHLATVLNVLLPRTRALEALYLNMSLPNVGHASLRILADFILHSEMRILSLRNQQIGANGTGLLVQGLDGSKLQKLDLAYNNIQVAGTKKLAAVLPQCDLQELDLYSCYIQDEGAIALGKVISRCHLQRLYLGINNIGDSGLKVFSDGLRESKINDLDLWGNEICSQGASYLAEALPSTTLVRLVLRNNPCISNSGISAIAKSLPFTRLEELDCGYVMMGDDGAVALSNYLASSSLKKFIVRNNDIKIHGIVHLARAIKRSGLQEVDFSYNNFEREGVEAIAHAISSKLQNLILEGLHLNDESISLLTSVFRIANLSRLDLADNLITDQGAATIADSLIKTRLRELYLDHNQIGDQGATSIGKVLANTTLQQISLALNQIKAAGAVNFARGIQGSQLRTVVFYSNVIGSEGGNAFAKAVTKSGLKYLNLAYCGITDDFLATLAENLADSQLETLIINYNQIQNQGVEALAGVLTTATFSQRSEWITHINTDTKRALAKGRPNTNLKRLALEANKIDSEGAKALCRVLPHTEIDVWRLNLAKNPIDPMTVDINTCVISSASRANLPYQMLYNIHAALIPAKLAILSHARQALPTSQVTPTPRPISYSDIGILLLYVGIISLLIYKLLRYSHSNSKGPLSYFFGCKRENLVAASAVVVMGSGLTNRLI